MAINRRGFLTSGAAGTLGLTIGGASRTAAAQRSTGGAQPFQLRMQFWGLIAHVAGPMRSGRGQRASWHVVLLNDAASHVGALGHRAVLKVPLANLSPRPAAPMLDPTNPDLAVFDLANVRLTTAFDGEQSTTPVQTVVGARRTVGAQLAPCPASSSDEEWRDISWLADLDKLLGKGKGRVRRQHIDGPWPARGLVSAVIPLTNGTVECGRPSKPGYEGVAYRFVQHEGAAPEPHEQQFYTDIVRYVSNPASAITLTARSLRGNGRRTFEIRALPGQSVVTVFVENVNPNAGTSLDMRPGAMPPSHHFLAYFDLVDPGRRCMPEATCCDASCDPPVYCFGVVMYF
jgi:hypothetical protein